MFHDPKLKFNPFNLNDLGVVQKKNQINPHDNTEKYKLPLEKQVKLRLKRVFNAEEVIQGIKEGVKISY